MISAELVFTLKRLVLVTFQLIDGQDVEPNGAATCDYHELANDAKHDKSAHFNSFKIFVL